MAIVLGISPPLRKSREHTTPIISRQNQLSSESESFMMGIALAGVMILIARADGAQCNLGSRITNASSVSFFATEESE
jgi:hypothetical protein